MEIQIADNYRDSRFRTLEIMSFLRMREEKWPKHEQMLSKYCIAQKYRKRCLSEIMKIG